MTEEGMEEEQGKKVERKRERRVEGSGVSNERV